MPAFFPILKTHLQCAFWYCQQHLFWFVFYLLNRSKTLSFHRCLQFWEEKKIKRGPSPVNTVAEAKNSRTRTEVQFSNFGAIFAAAGFMTITSVKIAWYEPNEEICLKRVIGDLHYKDLSTNWLVIVIVYAKNCKEE